jgi:hypothetical protein
MAANQSLIGFEPHQFAQMLELKRIEGKPLLYYVGDLMGDCAPWDRNRETPACRRAWAMRTAAWLAYREQKCNLLQRKVADHTYQYFAYPGKHVVPPLEMEEIRVRYLARLDRGGVLTAAVTSPVKGATEKV